MISNINQLTTHVNGMVKSKTGSRGNSNVGTFGGGYLKIWRNQHTSIRRYNYIICGVDVSTCRECRTSRGHKSHIRQTFHAQLKFHCSLQGMHICWNLRTNMKIYQPCIQAWENSTHIYSSAVRNIGRGISTKSSHYFSTLKLQCCSSQKKKAKMFIPQI